MTSLSITVDRHPGYCLVSLDGELDRNTERSFSRTVHRLVAGEQARLVVNTGHLAFCDSSGLLALITGQRRAEGAGGALRLIGVHGTLARLLVLTQLVDSFPPYTTLAQASHWPR